MNIPNILDPFSSFISGNLSIGEAGCIFWRSNFKECAIQHFDVDIPGAECIKMLNIE
jgi:hypothetical protein